MRGEKNTHSQNGTHKRRTAQHMISQWNVAIGKWWFLVVYTSHFFCLSPRLSPFSIWYLLSCIICRNFCRQVPHNAKLDVYWLSFAMDFRGFTVSLHYIRVNIYSRLWILILVIHLFGRNTKQQPYTMQYNYAFVSGQSEDTWLIKFFYSF